jgi:hypothetical protein
MDKLSPKKILTFITVIVALFHIREITELLAPIYRWFAESLGQMRHFPPGARSAIAFLTIILIVMVALKSINK